MDDINKQIEAHPVYAIMPAINDKGQITGKKVINGFILIIFNKISFCTTTPFNSIYGMYSIDKNMLLTHTRGTDSFRMFDNFDEANNALKTWINAEMNKSIDIQVNTIDQQINELQNKINKLQQKREKLLKKKK